MILDAKGPVNELGLAEVHVGKLLYIKHIVNPQWPMMLAPQYIYSDFELVKFCIIFGT